MTGEAMDEFRRKMNELERNGSEFFDLAELSEKYFGYDPMEKMPMIDAARPNDVFDPEVFQRHMISRLRQQKIHMKTEVWRTMITLFEKFRANGQYWQRTGPKQVGQIAMEVLSVFGKMNAKEMYEATTGRVYRDEDWQEKDAMIENEFRSLLIRFDADNFEFTLEEEFKDRIKKFLESDAVAVAICNAYNTHFKPEGSRTMEQGFVKSQASKVNVYRCDRLTGGLMGVTLRDGFLLCHGVFFKSPNDTYLATILAVSLHVYGHYCARKIAGSFGFSSPFSFESDGPPPPIQRQSQNPQVGVPPSVRQDPQFPGKYLEFGRAVELEFFSGISPRWELTKKEAIEKFIDRVRRGDPFPFYQSKEDGLREGLVQDERLPISFGAKWVPPAVRMV